MYELDFNYSPWYLLLCAGIAALFTWLMYMNTPVLSRNLRWFLMSFRFLVLFINAVLLIESVYSTFTKIKNVPVVVFLQDESESIPAQKDSLFVKNTYPGLLKEFSGKMSGAPLSFQAYGFSSA